MRVSSLERKLKKAEAQVKEARELAERYRNRGEGKLGFCMPHDWLPWEIEQMDKEDAQEAELLSNCCGHAPAGEIFDGFARCSRCHEMAEFKEVEE